MADDINTNNGGSPSQGSGRWKDRATVYPPAEEIVKALQDRGKKVKVTEKGTERIKHKFEIAGKLVAKVYKSIRDQFNKPPGLTENVHRGKQPLLKEFIISRKHVDVSETDPFFIPTPKTARSIFYPTTPLRVDWTLPLTLFRTTLTAR